MSTGNWVQILDKAVYSSHTANTSGKGMLSAILSLAMNK